MCNIGEIQRIVQVVADDEDAPAVLEHTPTRTEETQTSDEEEKDHANCR